MGLLDSEAGKRRLLTVEIPVIERYNEGRDAAYKIQLVRLGSTLVLRYRLKPAPNVYQLETRLERWFRWAFLDFLPLVAGVQSWQPPDRTTLFRAWGARACPECQRYFLPRIGALGVAQREDAPVAQIVG